MHPDTFYRLALSRVPKIGPIMSRALYNHFGSAEAIFDARPSALREVEGMGNALIGALQLPAPQFEAKGIMRFAERNDIQIIHYTDEAYPKRFRQQHGAPALFYYKGTADLQHKRTVAIIGTRKPTSRGIAQTEMLLSGLKVYDPLVISGLAYGIDICAHREALKQGLSTVGVLGSGLNQIYPHLHRGTAEQMITQGGLLSTHPHFVGPERDHFPARNRLVAMLADIVVVMESEVKGGSIITANMGLEAGKPVAAFPGRFDDKKSAGCNAIIKQQGCHLVEHADDVAKILNWYKSELQNKQGQLFQELTDTEKEIVKQLGEADGVSVDELSRQLEWSAGQLAGQLLSMECKGLVKALPGQRYRLAY